MNLQEQIRKVLRETVNESLFFRRRVDFDLLDKEFYENLNYVTNIFLERYNEGQRFNMSQFKTVVLNYLMDNYHGELSNWGLEDYPYDEIHEYLSEYFHNKIEDKYNEVFGGDVNESVKETLREETIKKFKKETVNRGKLSNLLEELTISYLGEDKICDIVAIYEENTYIILVLYNGDSGHYLNEKLEIYLKSYIPVALFAIITNTDCNEE
jgi:hypothetical protein